MLAVAISAAAETGTLKVESLAIPRPRPGEVLLKVAAAGVNRPDVLQRQGLYPIPADADPLPGLEVSGEVIELGSGVTNMAIGARMMALTHGGGYAEYCRVPAVHCLPVPACLSLVEAAAIPETFFTVWYNVFMRAALKSGETLLVHGGSSGIGSTAIQLAKASGARVITTAGSDEKCAFCESLGAIAVNYKDGHWAEAVKTRLAGDAVDVVLDMVAGDYIQDNLDLLAREGRYALIAFLRGPIAKLNVRRILTHRLTFTGSALRPQSIAEKAAIASELRQHVLPLLDTGQVKPIIYQSFALRDAASAHELMESSTHMGKLVLETDSFRNGEFS